MVFESCYCNLPMYGPSHASMHAGQLPFSIGMFDNASEFHADIPTFAHYLCAMGIADIPSVLIETAFISNLEEERKLNNPRYDILLKVISSTGPVESDKLLSWVFTIARNQVIDYYRVRGRDPRRVPLEDTHLISAEETDAPGGKEALRGVLGELMGELSTQDQRVLTAVDLEGMSQKAYAEGLGIDYSSAKSRVQ